MTGRPVLGLDGGASKTECAVAAPGGARLALVRGGGSNHESAGFDGAAKVVRDVVGRALGEAGLRPGDLGAACFAMAGMDIPPDLAALERRVVLPLGLPCPVRVCNDAFAALRAGAGAGPGVCVSLGTGITFCGRGAGGREMQFYRPSPPSLDRRIEDALLEEYQGLGPAVGFRDAYLRALGLDGLEALYWSTLAESRPFAPRVGAGRRAAARRALFDEPCRGDERLCAILRGYGGEVAAILVKMARALGIEGGDFALVLSGSVLTAGRHPALNDAIAAGVAAACPRCRPVLLARPPVEGAVLIARELADGEGPGQ